MNGPCAKCNKTVYPLEKINCLDKLWHKGCFRCSECNMALNMKTYKGYNKQPYCNAHYPQTKFTAVAETPESKRLAANTKNQSAVKYHEEFEKSRGKFTPVADDPETLRHKAQGKIVSNVAYHGDLEKKAAMEQMRPGTDEPINGVGNAGSKLSPTGTSLKSEQIVQIGKVSPVDPVHEVKDSPYSSAKQSTLIYTSEHGAVNNPPDRKVGSIADYDPVNERYGSIATRAVPVGNINLYGGPQESQIIPPPQQMPNQAPQHVPHQAPQHVPQQAPQQIPHQMQPGRTGRNFRAIYDYVAADDDEVSFNEGDVIVNCEQIDDGWMNGTVERTGQMGMLPANYVEVI